MNIKKVDDKPMVIHTKEKIKLHVKTAPETKIKAGNVLTVERTPKFAGAEREAKADNMDKRMSALKVKSICIIGKARGIIESNISGAERICPKWYTKKEVNEILQSGCISARTQMYCYMWLRKDM